MMKKLLESMSKIANTVTEDEFWPEKDDGGRAMKNTLKWSESDIDNVQSGLRDSDERLQDYYLAHLNYQARDNRYNGMMKAYDKAARPSYVELNFDVDEGSGRPWPVDIQDGRLYGNGERYLGGFDDQENFISESMVAEDDLGVEPKRPSREGARPARGHEAKPRYTTVAEDDAGIDNLLTSLRAGRNKIAQGDSYSESGKKVINQIYNALRGALMAGDVDAFNRQWEHYSATMPDAFDCLMDESGLDANSISTELAENEVDGAAEKAFDLQLSRARNGQRAGNALDAERKLDNREVDEATHPSLNRSPEERKANRELWDRINSKGVVPSIDRERYTDIKGLEGPFRFKSGRVVYYDPQEGKYYDRDRDMYLDNSESLGESDEETKMELPPHLQALIKKHGLDKVMMKTPKRIDHSIKDVTPAGYGPDAKLSESRAQIVSQINKVSAKLDKISDDGGKVLRNDPLMIQLKSLKAKLKAEKLKEGWESGPDEYERPERDPDRDYDERKQQELDDRYEKDRPPTINSYQCTGRGPNMEPNYIMGPEFATQEEAMAYREKLYADPKTPNPRDIGINTYRRKATPVGEDATQSNIPSPTNARPVTKELSELAVNPNKARPGQTTDVKFNGWNIRYQLKPKQGSGEFKGMAVHSQSAKTPPINATGTSAEDVLAQLKAKIASNKGSAEISASTVMVDFNVLVTRDIVGHNDVIYGDIVSHNGAPTLLISAENPGGMQRAMDRRANVNKTEGTTGQHAFSLSGKRAHAAGLTHARYTLGSPENYIPGVTAYPLEFNSEVHPGEVVRLSSPGVTIAYPTKSAGVATESTIVEYAGMNEIPKLRDRNDFKERMKTLSDIQLDPDTAKDPQLKAEVLRKRAELMKQARDQGLSESWVVVDSKNKAVKMFESKTLAYNYVIENMFESTLVVKHRDEIKESRSTEKFGRALDKAGKDQSGDRTGMPSMEERRARYLKQQAEKEAGKKVVKEYGATSTGSPTSAPGASAVPTPKAPTPVTPQTSNKPVAPVAATAPIAPGANPNAPATPGASTDAANLASAAARDPKIAAQVKAMAQAARPV